MDNVSIPHTNKNFGLKHPVEAVGLKYSVMGAIGMIVYFLVLRALNLIQYPEYRFINYIILAVVLYFALREERHLEHQKRLEYFPGIGTGLMTGTLCAMMFSIFVFIFAKLEPSFLASVKAANPFTNYINAYTVGAMIFAETLIFGMISTFVLMQLFKRNKETTK